MMGIWRKPQKALDMKNHVLRIVVTREEKCFAQRLEHDIAVQAPDMQTLQHRFEAALALESLDGNIDSIPPSA